MASITPLRNSEVTAMLLPALLNRAGDERVEVVRLTDEEVSVLDGPEADQVAPFPWLSTLGPEAQETAREVAARNLVLRGLATVSAAQETSEELVIAVEDDVYAVLAARGAASAVVIAQRQASAESRTRVVYVEGDLGAVEEDVSPGGVHTFVAGDLGLVLDELCAFVDPRGVAGQDGPPRDLGPTDDPARVAAEMGSLLPIDQAQWVSVVAALIPSDERTEERRLTVISLPDSVNVAKGSLEAGSATVRAVSRATLRKLVGGLLSA